MSTDEQPRRYGKWQVKRAGILRYSCRAVEIIDLDHRIERLELRETHTGTLAGAKQRAQRMLDELQTDNASITW